MDEVQAKGIAAGLTQDVVKRSGLDSEDFGVDRGFERYPLLRGHLSGSRDGSPVAPLLGTIKAFDGGTTDLHGLRGGGKSRGLLSRARPPRGGDLRRDAAVEIAALPGSRSRKGSR